MYLLQGDIRLRAPFGMSAISDTSAGRRAQPVKVKTLHDLRGNEFDGDTLISFLGETRSAFQSLPHQSFYISRASHNNGDRLMTVCKEGSFPNLDFFRITPEEDFPKDPRPQLRLILIKTFREAPRLGQIFDAGTFSLEITRADFWELFNTELKANPWVLTLLSQRYDGYHHVQAQEMYLATYYYAWSGSTTIWTFDRDTSCTSIIFLKSPSGETGVDSIEFIPSWLGCLSTPHVPLLAVTHHITRVHDGTLVLHARDIQDVELSTKYTRERLSERLERKIFAIGRKTAYNQDVPVSFHPNHLTELSRDSARVRIGIEHLLLHHDHYMRALETLKIDNTLRLDRYKDDYAKSMQDIMEWRDAMRSQSAAVVPYAKYLQKRAEAQINIIFALLTHKDAEASKEIAEAAKRDSSAMKTIAVVTMVFLPATFLAALFALPVLEFERKVDIRMNGFSLYWILACPLTVLVFIVWGLVTQREVFMKLIRGEKTSETQAEAEKGSATGISQADLGPLVPSKRQATASHVP